MKIINSFLLLTICISTTTLLYGQNVTPEITKPVADIRGSMPTPVPEFKPQPQATAATPAKTVEAPASVTKKEEAKLPQGKTELRLISNADIVIPGGEEGKKILAGNKTNPDATSTTPSTAKPPVLPPVIKPTLPGTGQQQ